MHDLLCEHEKLLIDLNIDADMADTGWAWLTVKDYGSFRELLAFFSFYSSFLCVETMLFTGDIRLKTLSFAVKKKTKIGKSPRKLADHAGATG